mmetsp:Transcript_25695/g.73939  ORF Transcript_25695/g.73939 Transcript_25695/m.73939 type:complete len:120 (-) Transcript_25695:287-646(-)
MNDVDILDVLGFGIINLPIFNSFFAVFDNISVNFDTEVARFRAQDRSSYTGKIARARSCVEKSERSISRKLQSFHHSPIDVRCRDVDISFFDWLICMGQANVTLWNEESSINVPESLLD